MITKIQNTLLSMKDIAYKEFSAKLIPTVDKDSIIGVRTPQLKSLAKKLAGEPDIDEFLSALPHKYFEENNLHAFIICAEKDYEKGTLELNRFLPFVDNWATCDGMRPALVKNNSERFSSQIDIWLKSEHTYTIRFAILMLMTYYLDGEFNPKYLEKVAYVKSDEYYINMMIAWYFATALAKQWNDAILYLTDRKLPKWIHNKTISKARESYRITPTQKEFLKTLR